jgi:hypothetical protein
MSDEQTETEQKMDVVVEIDILETNEESNKNDHNNDDHDDEDSNSNTDATSSGNIVTKNDATSQSSSSDNDCILGKEEVIHSGTINLIAQGDPSTPKQNGSNVSLKTSNSRSKSKLTVEQKAERAKKQAEERVN